jgi:Fe-S-cluster containining protein
VSPKEQRILGEDRFDHNHTPEDTPCEKLDKATGLCSIHDRRPIECRIFPLDLLVVDAQVHWVIWRGACPAVPSMTPEHVIGEMNRWDQELEPEWVQAYINHHLVNQPAKYRPGMFTVLRPYRAAKDSAQ